ncbi:hypothetical protein V5799_009555 [Amblyomma americanum]|uniref:Protein kinase domain-containing protein n=1 Tax=Amblyomma americanum TaxID=6943 RepID=A0AAQ4FAF7_AMBAM
MLIATILSTLVIAAFINYYCRKLQRRIEEEEARKREGASALAALYESSLKPQQATTTTYTVTSALCSVSEKGEDMTTAPRMATGDVPAAEPETALSPALGDTETDKEDDKQDPEVLSQGEGMQQQPSRGVAVGPPVGSPLNRSCDSKLTSSDPASSKWLAQKVVGLQSAARGFLLRRSVSQLQRERQAAAQRIQTWWRCKRSKSLDAAGDAFFSQYESMLDAPVYRVYDTDESEVTWSADETDMLIEHSDDSGESETTQQLKPQCSEESQLMFGDLMSVTDQSSPLKFADVMSFMNDAQGVVKFAEGTHCDLFRLHTGDGTCVLKVVNLEFIVKHWDTLYAEAVISLELTKLRKRVDYHTEGFTNTKRVFCLYDRYPRELIQAWKDYTSWKRTDHQYGPDTLDTPQPYLVFCFANAGVPLTQVKLDTALQLRSILQQVALSLAVAEAALQFEHRDLGLNHVLVDETTLQLLQFCIDGKSTIINSWGVRATVIDFAAARINNATSEQRFLLSPRRVLSGHSKALSQMQPTEQYWHRHD